MKKLEGHPDSDWDVWFWLDKEQFEGEWMIGECRWRVEKAVGRDAKGRLILMVWTNLSQFNWRKFEQEYYEIDLDEFAELLDRAIFQDEVAPNERGRLLRKASEPVEVPWDYDRDVTVYEDARFTLGQKDGEAYLTADGRTYILTCHPYEPCLLITDENGSLTALHNSFEPLGALDVFRGGGTLTSITGLEYDARDFCELVAYAVGMVDVQIDDAERVFCGRPKKKSAQNAADTAADTADTGAAVAHGGEAKNTAEAEYRDEYIIRDDPFLDLVAAYPDSVVDFCLVKDEELGRVYDAHRTALVRACGELFVDGDETIWHYDVGKADAKQIAAAELFDASPESDKLTFRRAFLEPPYPNGYTDADFARLVAALFPNGTDALEVFDWTTDWSEYFDDGHEWWGTLCVTTYDASLARFAVILASATD